MVHRSALIVLAISAFSAIFSCHGGNNIATTIDEKNNELNIRVDAHKNGKEIHYYKSFDIRGMNKSQRDSIVHHVFDSLHIGINESK